MSLYFSCGGISIELLGELPSTITKDVEHFFSEDQQYGIHSYKYYFRKVLQIDAISGIPVYQDSFRVILKKGDLETRIFTQSHMNYPYAVYEEKGDDIVYIQYLEAAFTSIDMRFIELFVIEKCLLDSNAIILHSCFIEYNDGAIIFTAPSGTGKSTQGRLWKQYEKAEIINGDRSILWNTDNGVYACGLPFCGSSTINRNRILPVHGIVIINQANKNVVEKIAVNQAIKKVLSEITINYWNQDFVNKGFSIIENIVKSTKVYKLNCTISKNAVSILKKTLFENVCR